jgi:hypothetical protein
MLKFADLSMSQKKCIVALIEHSPALKKSGRISLKEVIAITQELAKKRAKGGVKIGYPNWLFKSNKVERGVYEMPVPTASELSDYTKQLTSKPAKVAKVKVAKVKQPKVAKTVAKPKVSDQTRLEKIIDESDAVDQDVEDFNQILRENGITV